MMISRCEKLSERESSSQHDSFNFHLIDFMVQLMLFCAERRGKKIFEVGITCVKMACNNNYLSQQDIWQRKEDLKLLFLFP